MFQWAKSHDIAKVFMLADRNADFTHRMGMLVDRSIHCMAMRSWRCAMYVNDGIIEKLFAEPNVRDNPDGVSVTVSDAETVIGWLKRPKA
jgi:peroxiredoxin